MFVLNQFYKTKNGSKVRCIYGPDTDGQYCMSTNHLNKKEQLGDTYWVTSNGVVRGDKSRDMNIVGPWEETPKITLTFETEVSKRAFLTWFLFAGGSQDMRAFSSEDYPECPNLVSYDRDSETINFSHGKGEHK